MNVYAALIVTVIMFFVTVRYCYLTVQNKIYPVPATWIVASTTMSVSFWTYWHTAEHSILSNIGNATGVLNTLFIVTVVIFVRWKRGELSIAFTPHQKLSLKIVVVILFLWISLLFITSEHVAAAISNVMTQILMLYAYYILLVHLWYADQNTEDYLVWYMAFLAMIFALFAAQDLLACVYSLRAIVSNFLVIIFMMRVDKRCRAASK